MSSVAKTVTASTSPVPTRPGTNSRAVSSDFGQVSELYSQSGVRSEGESPGFEEYRKGDSNNQNNPNQQPPTLKIAGTSRSFAMLFEEVQTDQRRSNEAVYDDNGLENNGVPAFQAYMNNATNTYERSSKSIAGDYKNVGRSLNLAM